MRRSLAQGPKSASTRSRDDLALLRGLVVALLFVAPFWYAVYVVIRRLLR